MFHGPKQLAYAVADVRTAAGRWVDRGVGPWLVLDHIDVTSARVDGTEGEFDHSSAYGWSGELMIELIQQHDGGSAPIVATSGLHHVAYFVDDLETAADTLIEQGRPEVLRATATGGTVFAFHDARADLGHLIEIYEPTERLRGFYAMLRQESERWTGADPIRTP